MQSLLLLAKVEHYSGVNEWVTRTAAAMTPQERRRHELVIIGLHYAVMPEESWPSFPAYIDHLASCDPAKLRDRMLDVYACIPLLTSGREFCYDEPVPIDRDAVLKDVDSYLGFLRERFDFEHVDVELEIEAYSYAVDPPAMQDLIVSHLREMWDRYLAEEWERVEPMLQDAVRALKHVDLGRMDRREAAEWIAGQKLVGEKWDRLFDRAERIILVPSAHIGPYLGRFEAQGTHWLLFGARLPDGIQFDAPDLSRTEIVVRLSALADDNRLRILRLVADQGEQSSQEIMTTLDFSQSAASRHLKQLSATGYLTGRRCNGAKCYRLDPERVEDTLRAVSRFLLVR
jgi:DNA-binding transcriptional ArsR family regulator